MEQPVSTLVPPPKTAKVAFQYGLIFGLIQAAIASTVLVLNDSVNANSLGASLLLSSMSFLTGLAAYFVSGILAAKQNGKVRTGVFAGMWTGGIYGIIGFVVSMVLFFQVSLPKLIDTATASGTYANMDAFKTGAEIGGVGAAIFGILFAVGLGAGLGALGGLIGRNISKYKPVTLVPALVPGYAPYPGQPVYTPPTEQAYADPNQPAYPYQPADAGQIYVEQPVVNPYANNPPQQ